MHVRNYLFLVKYKLSNPEVKGPNVGSNRSHQNGVAKITNPSIRASAVRENALNVKVIAISLVACISAVTYVIEPTRRLVHEYLSKAVEDK
jgi:hypothetical protein